MGKFHARKLQIIAAYLHRQQLVRVTTCPVVVLFKELPSARTGMQYGQVIAPINPTTPRFTGEFQTNNLKRIDMRKYRFLVSLAVAAACLVPMGLAQDSETYNPLPRHFPTKARFVHERIGPGGGGGNLSYHGGPVITTAYVVPIFWGASWSGTGSDSWIAASLTNYIDGGSGSGAMGFGQTGEFHVITQYSNITASFLGQNTGALYDTLNPPTNVTDAILQQEVVKVLNAYGPLPDTVYEVFLPSTSYSSSGTATSCGGPNLQYCAYHFNFTSNGVDIKYASMPYPSCSGCQSSGFNVAQNLEHFISHETREAVTDPDGTAWFDRRGYEADDKCAWSPTPFTDSTTGTNADTSHSAFAYQYEWSNANSGCVKTR
jgi:hypothetical protein